MNCPNCSGTEFDSEGVCQSCGHKAGPAEPELTPSNEPDIPASEASPEPPAAEGLPAEIPEWRQELSRRLQEIKSRRESAPAINESAGPAVVLQPPESEPVRPPSVQRRPRRVTPFPDRERVPKSVEQPDPGPSSAEVLVRREESGDRQEIKNLIDEVVLRQETKGRTIPDAEPPPVENAAVPQPQPQRKLEFNPPPKPRADRKPEPVPMPDYERGWSPDESGAEQGEDKLILLTRTLAGLVDLIIVLLCGGCIILSIDILEGIETWDNISKFHYGLVFLATYFVYSFFFLGMANQTIGMMMTDLRVVSDSISRASAAQIVVRCLSFLLGSAAAGTGLLWGVFDRQSRCLHDLLSHTRVMRVQ